MMAGGWMSFQGYHGQARFHDTAVEAALPVTLLPGIDDRVEVPEGFNPRVREAAADHPILQGIPAELPPMLFYNRLRLRPEAECLMVHGDDPILAVWEHGNGRAAAFAPDIAYHGATREFLEWPFYGPLFTQVLNWLTRRSRA